MFHQFLTDGIDILSNCKNICILRNPTEPEGLSCHLSLTDGVGELLTVTLCLIFSFS